VSRGSDPTSRGEKRYLNGPKRSGGIGAKGAGSGAIAADGTQSTAGGGPAIIGATRGGGGGNRRVGSQQGGMGMTGGGHTAIGQCPDALAQGAPAHAEAKSSIVKAIILLFLSMIRQSFLVRLV
jgi:hypothetical protein